MMRFSGALRFCVGLLLGCLISVAVPALWPDAGVTAPPSEASMLAQSSEPDVLLRQGRAAYEAGEMASAVQQLQGAAQAYGERGEPLNQAIALNYLSLAQQQQGQWREAEAVIKESLDLIGVPSATARDDRQRLFAAALTTRGQLQLAVGQAEAAFESWQEAERRYERLGDVEGRWGSQLNQARALEALGLYRRSCDQLLERLTGGGLSCDGLAADDPDVRTRQREELLAAIELQPDSRLKAMALRSLGNQLRLLGQLDLSEQVLQESLTHDDSNFAQSSSYLALGNTRRAKVARAYNLRQFSQEDRQNYEEPWDSFSQQATMALGYYQRAINLSRSPNLRLQGQLNRLELLSDLTRLLPEKAEYLQIQLAFELVPLGFPLSQDYKNQLDQSDRERAQFRKEAEALVDPIYSQISLLPLSRTKVEYQLKLACRLIDCDRINLKQTPLGLSGSGVNPLTLLQDALTEAEDLDNLELQSQAYGILGKFYERNSQWETALDATQKAAILGGDYKNLSYQWKWQKGRILQSQQEQNFSDLNQSNAAIESYRQASAILKEMRQDMALLDSNIQYDFRDKIEPVYRQFVAVLLQDNTTEDKDFLEEARQTIEDLQIAEIDNFFQDACVTESNVPIDTVVDNLDPTSALIYTIILGNQLHVISKLPQQPLHHHSILLESKNIVKNTLFNLFANLADVTRNSRVKPDAITLYNWLIKPIETRLKQSDVETLVFVLDTTLQRIPMSVLYNPATERFLIQDYAIAITPGINIIEPKALDSFDPNALTAGLSEERLGFKRLQGVEQEIRNLSQLLGSQTLLNESFTRSAVERSIDSGLFSIVHLATHGNFSSNPERTFLLLSDDLLKVRTMDTVFRLNPITRTNPIELLVMSACKTAAGDERAALGLAGMTIRSGARSTLATLWQAEDNSTANFMVEFYRRLQTGENKAKALRNAQLELLNSDSSNFRVWAPYVLVGNWL